MGVPRLAHHLRPYAETRTLGGQTVVVDGPSLAYHVYYMAITKSINEHRNVFEAASTYEELGCLLVEFLNLLEACKVTIGRIYFDGFLPLSKYPVRLERLQGYTALLNHYHEAWPQLIPSKGIQSPAVEKPRTQKLSQIDEAPFAAASRLPASPFLVPAMIEKLKVSKYSPITEVTPSEADQYCARYARDNGCVILSSDSDLLVYDIGDRGCVVHFKDIDISNASETCLMAPHFEPALIARKLGFQNSSLISLAFQAVLDNYSGLTQWRKNAAKHAALLPADERYATFAEQYVLDNRDTIPTSEVVKTRLRWLHPRISEFVLRLPLFSAAPQKSMTDNAKSIDDSEQVRMFLPFILDCPSRSSAWNMSSAVRQLAYGLVNVVLPGSQHIATVTEHCRQQNGSKGRAWQLPTVDQLIEACKSLSSTIFSVRVAFPDGNNVQIWRAMTFVQELEFTCAEGKPSLFAAFIKPPANEHNKEAARLTWDAVHCHALTHSCLYSFQILKQILEVVIAIAGKECDEALTELHKGLHDLPLVLEYRGIADELRVLRSAETRADFNTVFKTKQQRHPNDELSVGNPEQTKMNASARKARKRKRGEKPVSSRTGTYSGSANMFELLPSQ